MFAVRQVPALVSVDRYQAPYWNHSSSGLCMWSRIASQQVVPKLTVISEPFSREPSRRRLLWSAVVAMSQPGEYTYK